MSAPTQPLVRIDTLGACIDRNYRIALHCEQTYGLAPCNYFQWLDLEKLAAKLGRDHGCLRDDLVPHLWCLRCGSHNVSIRLHSLAPKIRQ